MERVPQTHCGDRKSKLGTVSNLYDNFFAGEDGRSRHSEVIADLVVLEVEVFLKEDRTS
jgi:hypothetical protein